MSDVVLNQTSNPREPGARRRVVLPVRLGLCALLWPATACLNFPNPGNEKATEEANGGDEGSDTKTEDTESESSSGDDGESTTEDSGDESPTLDSSGENSGKGVELDWRREILPGQTVVPIQVTVDGEGNAVALFSGLGDSSNGRIARYSPDGDELLHVEFDAAEVSADELHGYHIVFSEEGGAYMLVAANRGDEQDLLLQRLDDQFDVSETVELGAFEEPFDLALDDEGRPSVMKWRDRRDLKREDYDHDLKLRDIQEYVLNPVPSDLNRADCKINRSGHAFVAYNHASGDEAMVRYAFLDDSGTLQWTDDYNTGKDDNLFGVEMGDDGAAYLVISSSNGADDPEGKVIFLRLNEAGDVDWVKHIPIFPDGQKRDQFMRGAAVVNEAGLFVHSVHGWRTDGDSKLHGLLQIRHYDVAGNEIWHYGADQELDPPDTTPGQMGVEPGEHIYVLTNSLRTDVGLSSLYLSHYVRAP